MTLDELRNLYNQSPQKALEQIQQEALTPSALSNLLTATIKYYPSKDLICFLRQQGGTIPPTLFHWLIDDDQQNTFELLWRLGYKPAIDSRDDEYGATLAEMALAKKNAKILSLITGRNRLICFLQTRFSKLSLHSQFWLIRRLQLLDFPQDMKGICYVAAMFGGQAVLIGEADNFMRRMALIKATPSSKLAKKIAKAYDRRRLKKQLTQTHQDYLDFFDFGHAVTLIQGHHYPELDEALQSNDDMPRYFLNSLQSVAIEKAGGIKWIGSECEVIINLQQSEQLTNYFAELKRLFDRSHKTLAQKQAVFIYIAASNHGVSLGYDIKTQEWFFTDSNHSRVMLRVNDTGSLASLLGNAYRSFGKKLTFGFSLFTTGDNEIRAKGMIEPYWHSLHYRYFKAAKAAKNHSILEPMPIIAAGSSAPILLLLAGFFYPYLVLNSFGLTSSLAIFGLWCGIALAIGILVAVASTLVIYLARQWRRTIEERPLQESPELKPTQLTTRHTFFSPRVNPQSDNAPSETPCYSF